MALYAISIDPLARKINNNGKISGATIGRINMKIQQYADDMTVFLAGEKELPHIFKEFEQFEQATGQKLNAEKTEILHLNEKPGFGTADTRYEKLKKQEIQILGQTR